MFEIDQVLWISFMWIIVVHASLAVIGFFFLKKDVRIKLYLDKIGGPPLVPFIGNALTLMGPHESIIPALFRWVEKYGFTFYVWLGNVPYVVVSNPYHLEKILSSTVHINKGEDYETFLESWLGTGLLTARREKWFHRRKLLTPTFHFKILEDFVPTFNEQAKIMIELLEEQRQLTDTFDITPFISRCTLDVICETAMGEKINSQRGGEAEYVKMVCGITDILLQKGMNPIYRSKIIWNLFGRGKLEIQYLTALHAFTDKMIQNRKSERRAKTLATSEDKGDSSEKDENISILRHAICAKQIPESKRRKAFLDLLLDLQESENKLTDADIREEVDTFMFEGHDTTGANMDWTLLLLACNPECQEKVHEELDSVFANDMDRDITTSDLTQLKYLGCCIQESLRIYPSVPFFLRKVEEDIPLEEDKIIPKGCTINISPILLHRFPEIFPDPEKFDPMRFNIENSAGRHPYSYVPFSAGPRNCIGQKFALIEEKIILATLLRKFRVEPVDTRETVPFSPEGVLRPVNGIRLKLISKILETK